MTFTDKTPKSVYTTPSPHPFLYALPLCVVASYLLLNWLLPISINAKAGHDDAWFIYSAQSISSGEWLGAFNELTLIKGPVYSLFLATNEIIGFPLWLSHSLFFVVACATITHSLNKVIPSTTIRLLLFSAVLFEPALLPIRVIRDNIYPALLLLSLAGLIFLSHPSKYSRSVLYLIPLGVALSLFFHTREEGIWILPGAALLFTWSAINAYRLEHTITPFTLRALSFFGAAIVTTALITLITFLKYDTTDIVDFKNKEFQNAINAIAAIRIDSEQPYLPAPQEKRLLAYKHSPAFEELSSTLESPYNQWKQAGCMLYPHTCGDYAGGWFPWALKAAAQQQGKYASAKESKLFFGEIYAQLSAACQTNELKCDFSIIPFIPKISEADLRRIPDALHRGSVITIHQWDRIPYFSHSFGSSIQVNQIEKYLNQPNHALPVFGKQIQLTGPAETIRKLKIICKESFGRPYTQPSEIFFSPISSITELNTGGSALLKTNIPAAANCSTAIGTTQTVMSMEKLLPGRILQVGEHKIYIKRASTRAELSNSQQATIKVREFLFSTYKYTTPAFIFAAAIGFILVGRAFYKNPSQEWHHLLIPLGLWILYLSRLVILAIIDITSFPGMNHLYLMPAFPLLVAASITTINAAINSSTQAIPTRL